MSQQFDEKFDSENVERSEPLKDRVGKYQKLLGMEINQGKEKEVEGLIFFPINQLMRMKIKWGKGKGWGNEGEVDGNGK